MKITDKEIEKYISEVSSRLLCPMKKKKYIIEDIKNSVFDFAEINDINSIDEIYNHFGTPEEIAKVYLSENDPKKIKNKINIRRVVILTLLVALIIFVLFIVAAFIESQSAMGGYTVISPAEEIMVNIVTSLI